MDLYEYQARQLLEEQDIDVPKAVFAQNSHEVAEAADIIGYPVVIKAQVKIGHRGQAGGVRIAHDRDEAILISEDILPMTIHGHKVSGILVTEAKNILHEYYVSISVDRSSRDFDVLATANGGTEVEEVARKHPESVKRLHISALEDFDLEAATKMAESIGFYHADSAQAAQILLNMWRCFKQNDATLVEINHWPKSATRTTNLRSRCAHWMRKSHSTTTQPSVTMDGSALPTRSSRIRLNSVPVNTICITCISPARSVSSATGRAW